MSSERRELANSQKIERKYEFCDDFYFLKTCPTSPEKIEYGDREE
jgi:hypothetical protein